LLPRYNIAPSQDVLVIVQRGDERKADHLKWGLVPSWSKEAKGFINARSETIAEKPSFSESFERRRCLIPADGYYEWRRSEKIAQPYFFQMQDESTFAFAGIWDQWKDGKTSIVGCAIITTSANELLEPIHNRMPVILHSHCYDFWLNEDSRSPELKSLLVSFPAAAMRCHAVSYEVNNTKSDDEKLVKPVEPDLFTTPMLF
jgi:putative SOS response-associated peptidase YedK